MTRTHLLGAASAAALACLSTASFATTKPGIFGGGSTLAGPTYVLEFSSYNATKTTKATFSTYWEAGSGTGQQSFIQDDLTCDIVKVNGGTGCNAQTQGLPANVTDYGASDATLSGAQISSWATSSFGQAAAGDLIQIPSMGVGISFPVVNSAVTTNGQAQLSDNDLCGIFSGKITTWEQVTDSGTNLTPGTISVVFRTDGSGTTFLLTSHLNAVCNSGNSNISFTAVQTFASLFTSLPTNFVGQKGSQNVASYMAGCAGTVSSAIGYLSPDYTTLYPNSAATLTCQANGSNYLSTLVVASAVNAADHKAYLPTVKDIFTGLTHASKTSPYNSNPTPPANANDGANPAKWVPGVPVVTSGYPVVGYTTFDFAQCYQNTVVGSAIIAFLKDHFYGAAYTPIESNNGFVALKTAFGGAGFYSTIFNNILANKSGWNTDIDNATACAGRTGR